MGAGAEGETQLIAKNLLACNRKASHADEVHINFKLT